MGEILRLAVVGVGRIGVFHARHVQELAGERGDCELVAVVDTHADTAKRVARRLQGNQESTLHHFKNIDDLLDARLIDAAVVASRTEDHCADTLLLVVGRHDDRQANFLNPDAIPGLDAGDCCYHACLPPSRLTGRRAQATIQNPQRRLMPLHSRKRP